jgi:DNA-directed RNA polymerase specialized sigma24 family protein
MNEGWSVTATDAIDVESAERVIARIQTLPETTRRVATLRKIYGLSEEEIARQLGISAADVEDHLAAAVAACADMGEISDG